jgi:hypothetical protein
MNKLPRYEFNDRNQFSIPTISKMKGGNFIHKDDLIKYLKSFDENEEIIKVMDYIITTQLSE